MTSMKWTWWECDYSLLTSVPGLWPSVQWDQHSPTMRLPSVHGGRWSLLMDDDVTKVSRGKNPPTIISRIPKQFHNSDSKRGLVWKGSLSVSSLASVLWTLVIIFLKKIEVSYTFFLKDFSLVYLEEFFNQLGFSPFGGWSQWLGNMEIIVNNQAFCKRCYLRRGLWVHTKLRNTSVKFSLNLPSFWNRRKDDF